MSYRCSFRDIQGSKRPNTINFLFKYFCFVTILDMSLISRSCKNDHIIFNVGTPSLEARNIRLVNIITYIIEESKLISENMSPNVIHC